MRFLIVVQCTLLATIASAQPASSDVTFTGSLRSRLYVWDWFQPASGNNGYVYSGNLLRIGFSQTKPTWDWNAEFAVPFLLGLPVNATGTGPQQGALGLGSNYVAANGGSQNTAMIFPKQLYIRFSGLQIGRFDFLDGTEIAPKYEPLATVKRDRISQRLIGNFSFSDVGRSFDGLHYALGNSSDNFTFVAAIPHPRRVSDRRLGMESSRFRLCVLHA
jgi:hypothetical protein